MNLIFKTAAYIRLSKEDGDKEESDSVKNQKTLLLNYISSHSELTLYNVYIDDGYTGTNFRRPEFQKMISDIEAGYINCVIVKDLSRFGRNYLDAGRYLERYFPEMEVRFISITEDIDSKKQAYDLMLPLKNLFNEQYSRDISAKVSAAIRTKQKSGDFIGAFPCYGYRKLDSNKNKLVVDEYAASVVRRIFDLYVQGAGMMKIVRTLNQDGILCPSEYKRVNGDNYKNCNILSTTTYWTYSTVNVILHREMYIGNMVQGVMHQQMRGKAKKRPREEWAIVEGTHEPIIDRETWDKAQSLLKRRTRSLDFETNNSIFAGFLKCGDCGRAMSKTSYTRNGKKRCTFSCGSYKRCGRTCCTPHTITLEVLEGVILEDLRTIIQHVDNLEELIANEDTNKSADNNIHDAEIATTKAQLERIRLLKKSVYEDYKDALISKEEYLTYREDYKTKEELYIKQIELLEEKKTEAIPEDITQIPWIKKLLKMKNIEELSRDIIVEMIDKIEIFEKKRIKITYRFGDEMKDLFSKVYDSKF